MNWNADCEPGLIAQTSVPDLTHALVAEREHMSAARFQNQVESLQGSLEAVVVAYQYTWFLK